MLEFECVVECTARNAAGEAFVRVHQLYDSFYYGDGASLDGCPLVNVPPWREDASPLAPRLYMDTYDFHLSRAEDVQRFSPGLKVMFKPGTPKFGR